MLKDIHQGVVSNAIFSFEICFTLFFNIRLGFLPFYLFGRENNTQFINPSLYLQSAMSSSSKANKDEARSTSGALLAIMCVTSAILLFW